MANSISVENGFRAIAADGGSELETSVLSRDLAYCVVEDSELRHGFRKCQEIAKSLRSRAFKTREDARAYLGRLFIDSGKDDFTPTPFAILDTELLGAFARARAQSLKTRNAELVIAVVDTSLMEYSLIASYPALQTSLGHPENPNYRYRALVWGDIPRKAIVCCMSWSKIVQSDIVLNWFDSLNVNLAVPHQLVTGAHFRQEWLKRQWRFSLPSLSAATVLLCLWEDHGLDPNEESTQMLVATFLAWSQAILHNGGHKNWKQRVQDDIKYQVWSLVNKQRQMGIVQRDRDELSLARSEATTIIVSVRAPWPRTALMLVPSLGAVHPIMVISCWSIFAMSTTNGCRTSGGAP